MTRIEPKQQRPPGLRICFGLEPSDLDIHDGKALYDLLKAPGDIHVDFAQRTGRFERIKDDSLKDDWFVYHDSEDALKAKPYLVERLRFYGFTREMILLVCQAIDNTCHSCWEAEVGCQCWNDE